MRGALPFLLPLAVLGAAGSAQAEPSRSLCAPGERTVFACEARTKVVSVCATGELRRQTGALTYRFGEYGKAPELVHASTPATVKRRFLYDETIWGKGMSTTLRFNSGQFAYAVHHAHGAFGVDGGPNTAGVTVTRGSTEVASIACREEIVVNRMYEELSGTALHAGQ